MEETVAQDVAAGGAAESLDLARQCQVDRSFARKMSAAGFFRRRIVHFTRKLPDDVKRAIINAANPKEVQQIIRKHFGGEADKERKFQAEREQERLKKEAEKPPRRMPNPFRKEA